MNGPKAAEAKVPEIFPLPHNITVKESIANRVPEHEPWDCHFIEKPTLVMPYGKPAPAQPKTKIAPEIAKDKPS